jgi:hypothetical protein
MDILVLSVYTYTSTYTQMHSNQFFIVIFKANKKNKPFLQFSNLTAPVSGSTRLFIGV